MFPDRIEIHDRLMPADGAAHEAAFWFHSNRGATLVESGRAVSIPGNAGSVWRLSSQSGLGFEAVSLGGDGSENRTAFVARTSVSASGGTFAFLVERTTQR